MVAVLSMKYRALLFLDYAGKTPSNGHYTTYVINSSKHWSFYNDSEVTSDYDITDLINGIDVSDYHGKKRPYHLTYCRDDKLTSYLLGDS